MPDQVTPLDAEGGERAVENGGETRRVGTVERLGRAAMARQVERDRAAAFGERRLGEHPAVEVGAKAMHQHDRGRLPGAEIEDPQLLAAGIDVAREERSEEHTSELQSQSNLVCRLLLEKKKKK